MTAELPFMVEALLFAWTLVPSSLHKEIERMVYLSCTLFGKVVLVVIKAE